MRVKTPDLSGGLLSWTILTDTKLRLPLEAVEGDAHFEAHIDFPLCLRRIAFYEAFN